MFLGGGAVIPAWGRNGEKLMLEFGWATEMPKGGKFNGNGLTWIEPLPAEIKGVANSGGAGLV